MAATIGAAVASLDVPFYLAQRSLGGADNSLPRPGLAALIGLYGFDSQFRVPVVALLLAMFAFAYLAIPGRDSVPEQTGRIPRFHDQVPVQAYATTLLAVFALCVTAVLVPLTIWMESFVGLRLFLQRYMLPTFVVWPCVLAIAIERLTLAADQSRLAIGGKLGAWMGHSPKLCCALLGMLSVVFVTWNIFGKDERIPQERAIAKAVQEYGVGFASTELHATSEVRHLGGPATFVKVVGGDQPKVAIKIAESLDRRYWNGYVISSDDLKSGNWTFIVRRADWNQWLDAGMVSDDWRIVKQIDTTLLIVER